MNRRTVSRLALVVVAVALLVALPAILTACGGTAKVTTTTAGTASGGTAPGDTSTYTDPTYGFSFTYPSGWKVKSNDQAQVTSGASSKYTLGAFNPNGATAQGSFIDVMEVQLFVLDASVTESERDRVKPEVQNLFANLTKQSGDWKPVDQLTDVTYGDLWGWKMTYSFTVKDTPSYTTFYVLFHGTMEYQLLVQASAKTWDSYKTTFDTFVTSFKAGTASAASTTASTSK